MPLALYDAVQRLETHRLARFGAFITVTIIAIALFFGRDIATNYRGLRFLIPVGGGIVLTSVLTFLFIRARELLQLHQDKETRSRITRIGLLNLALLAACVTLSEMLIVADVERMHVIKYSTLSFLLFYSQQNDQIWRRCAIAIAIAGTIGITEESIQLILPNRYFDYRDIAINLASVGLGGMLGWSTNLLGKSLAKAPPNKDRSKN